MVPDRRLLRMLVSLVAVLYAACSSAPALACACNGMDMAGVPSMEGRCPDMSNPRDCAVGCAALCSAVAPSLVEYNPPDPAALRAEARQATNLLSWDSPPRAPPPRGANPVLAQLMEIIV